MTCTNDATHARATDDHPDVAILRWPEERALAAALGRAERPRLLLVAPGEPAPEDWDRLTDWIRLPADELDVWTRAAVLQWRFDRGATMRLDDDDVLWRGREHVALSGTEALLMGVMLEAGARICTRRELARAAWPDSTPDGRLFEARIDGLRSKLMGLGLRIHLARGRGYVLELAR